MYICSSWKQRHIGSNWSHRIICLREYVGWCPGTKNNGNTVHSFLVTSDHQSWGIPLSHEKRRLLVLWMWLLKGPLDLCSIRAFKRWSLFLFPFYWSVRWSKQSMDMEKSFCFGTYFFPPVNSVTKCFYFLSEFNNCVRILFVGSFVTPRWIINLVSSSVIEDTEIGSKYCREQISGSLFLTSRSTICLLRSHFIVTAPRIL